MSAEQGQDPLPFEERKWNDELECRREDRSLKARELDLREREIVSEKSRQGSAWSNPLVLSISGVAVAGLLNFLVAVLTFVGNTTLESDKHLYQKILDTSKATRDVLSDTYKITDDGERCRRLKFLDEVNFPSDATALASGIRNYLSKCALAVGQAAPKRKTVAWESQWLGGGNSQSAQCVIGQSQVQAENPGKSVLLVASNEASRKDLLGQVAYKYFCTFDVVDPK